jgi:flagellar assembly protein FliH
MKNSVKFTFDTHFDGAPAERAAPDARSRKSYSSDEIEQLKLEAREQGRKDGDILASQALAQSIGQVASAVLAAIEAMDAEVELIRSEAADLAFAASKKLAGAALSNAPEAEIVETLRMALSQAVGEPRVVVKTPPMLSAKIESRAAEIASEQGFEGRIQFVGDSGLAGADCRIEWRGGGIERAQATIEQALDDLVARRFSRGPVEENA